MNTVLARLSLLYKPEYYYLKVAYWEKYCYRYIHINIILIPLSVIMIIATHEMQRSGHLLTVQIYSLRIPYDEKLFFYLAFSKDI